MIHILDASVALKWFTEEQGSAKALEYKDGLLAGKLVLAAPDLMLYEVANVLHLKKEFTEAAVKEALRFLLDIGVEIFTPTEEIMDKAVHYTFHTDHSFYDCLYIALAANLGARLLTADEALYKKARLFVPAILL
ncbi:MAG: type II toxin-antitoxin system VapC family toxin [Elusimicrobia bacterium]|nr:type II toxin-antitoxin system VapC family toxin [Elusimicrobiota bacterium]